MSTLAQKRVDPSAVTNGDAKKRILKAREVRKEAELVSRLAKIVRKQQVQREQDFRRRNAPPGRGAYAFNDVYDVLGSLQDS